MKKITVASWLTLTRIVLVIPFVWLWMANTKASLTWAVIVFAVAAITDALDGYLARKRNEVSDKMLVNSAFACFAVTRVALVPVWVPLIWWE